MTILPGLTMTIYNITDMWVINFIWHVTQTISQLSWKTGIFQLNVNIFSEHGFMPAYTTDRPNPKPGPALESLVLSVNNDTCDDFTIW